MPITPFHGKDTCVFIDDVDLSEYFNQADTNTTIPTSNTTTFKKKAATYTAGQPDGSLRLGGIYDGETDEGLIDRELARLPARIPSPLITVAFGDEVGRGARICQGIMSSYNVSDPVNDVIKVSADFQADEGVWPAVVLNRPVSTAFGSLGNSASVDNGEATSTGGVAILHVLANTLDGDATFTVEDSTDDTTFAAISDLAFTVTAGETGAQRLEIDETVDGTVNRYVRCASASGTSTSGSIRAILSFARYSF